MTEKRIFVYKLFLSLNISNFSLLLCKKLTPRPEKGHPLSKLRSCQAPLFENLVGGSTPSPRLAKEGFTLCPQCEFPL